MRRKKLSVFSVPLFFLIIFSSCSMGNIRQYLENREHTPTTVLYSIGDLGPSGSGIVFYVSDGGLHGLEITPWKWQGGLYDPVATWGNNSVSIGTSTNFGTGSANTALMEMNSIPAAQLCRNYIIGGFQDWFLPSKDEWDQIYLQKALLGNFEVSALYWSSSQSSAGPQFAFAIHSENGTWEEINENNVCYIRPIRAF